MAPESPLDIDKGLAPYEGNMMGKRTMATAGLAVAAIVLAGWSSTSNTASSSSSAAGGGKIGVSLPDAASSPRWESTDRPNLEKAITAAGFEPVIQNATKSVDKFSQICDSLINQGVKILMIVNLDSQSGAACQKKALDAGIKNIDYDRLTLGGYADYYIAVDPVQVGVLMGNGLRKCLTDAGKTKANIVFINGDPTDNNAKLFKQGYAQALKPAIDSGSYTLVGDQTGKWDATVAQTTFEQIFTQNNGKVDGVVSANDTMAGGIVTVLTNNKLAGKVPVTGQDASDPGLQRVIVGTQCGTVLKDTAIQAKLAADVAVAVAKGDTTAADALATNTVDDSVGNRKVKSAFAAPEWITKENIKKPFDVNYTTVAKVCTPEFQAACAAVGLK